MKTKYVIELIGCDDTTNFEMELTEDELKLLQRVAKKSKETSSYSCMPIMRVYLPFLCESCRFRCSRCAAKSGEITECKEYEALKEEL